MRERGVEGQPERGLWPREHQDDGLWQFCASCGCRGREPIPHASTGVHSCLTLQLRAWILCLSQPQRHRQAAVGADGHAEVLCAPLVELCATGDVPLQPALMGNLVPQQLNLWMGTAQQGPPDI